MHLTLKLLLLLMIFLHTGFGIAYSSGLTVLQRTVGEVKLTFVELPAGTKAKVGLAHRGVGYVEDLASIAKREGAAIAINGTYFGAYGGRPDPYNNLISNGKVLHMGDVGTTIGFFNNRPPKIDAVKLKITGATNGSYTWPNNWSAWGMNHTPDASGAYIFTPERGPSIGFAKGVSIVVSKGTVIKKVINEDAPIPADGYVINFVGSEAYQAKLFSIGTKVEYKVTLQANGDWSYVKEGLGAGPKLVTNGVVSVNPQAEGFTEAKITEWSSARSAIGIKKDGTIILATTPSATVKQLAEAMKAIGAEEALNLDGGASTGLWLNGQYIFEPGRQISNALLFYTN